MRLLDREVLGSSLADLSATLGAAGDVDVVVHLAAAGVSPKHASPDVLWAVNVELPARLVAAAAHAGVDRLVIAGTAAEYGRIADEYSNLPADAPLRPTSAYARSKAIGFAGAVDAAHEHEVTLDHLRVFNAFGPGQDPRALWPALHEAAARGNDLDLSSGEQVRDFIPVGAVADAFVTAVCPPPPTCDAGSTYATSGRAKARPFGGSQSSGGSTGVRPRRCASGQSTIARTNPAGSSRTTG